MDYIKKELRRAKKINILFGLFLLCIYTGFVFFIQHDSGDIPMSFIFPLMPISFTIMICGRFLPSNLSNYKFIKDFKIGDKYFICAFSKSDNTFYILDKLVGADVCEDLGEFEIDKFVNKCVEEKMDNDLITEEFISNEINNRAGEAIAKFQVKYLQETVKKEKIEDLVSKI